MKKQAEHINNTYAFDVENKRIHISQAESGRNGYFCMGCKVQMEARKGKIREHYFAHIPKEIGITRKCTFSDETYRHELARHILIRLKKITVPTVYIYPPNGKDGKPQIVRKKQVIVAKSATTEKCVFENELGEVKIGPDTGSSEKNVLFRPDVIFYDEQQEPILFIEVVATHKVNRDKIIKLKRIGIDCVATTIPKTSPQDIEDTFLRTNRTKWLFNYEKEITTYFPNTSRNKSSIPPLDKFERKLLKTEESYECRKAEIGNVIRTIRRSLESEQYRDVEEYLNREIKRTEENTEISQNKWRAIEERVERENKEEFRMEEELLSREENEVTGEEKRLQQEIKVRRVWLEENSAKLEERYSRKREELDKEQKRYRGDQQDKIDKIEQEISQHETRKNEIGENIERLEKEIKETEFSLKSHKENLPIRWKEYRTTQQEQQRHLRSGKKRIKNNIGKQEEELRESFERDRISTIVAYETADSEKLPGNRRLLNKLIRAKEACSTIANGRRSIKRFNFAKKLLDKNIFKKRDRI